MAIGQIRKALSGFYYVKSGDALYQTRARGNFRKRRLAPLVGDRVEFSSTSPTDGYILAIQKRHNQLKRPPVANVDQAVVVTSAVKPDFNSNLLDRFLVILEAKEIQPLIYLTKTDLLDEAALAKLTTTLAYYQKIGYPVFMAPDPYQADNIAALLRPFKDRLTVLTGQSGAGKSTLINHIAPELQLQTAAVSESLSRGKHTTRHVELWPLADGLVADTPGFSSLALTDLDLNTLGNLFPDFVALADQCKYRGCQHDHEPGCAVKAAVTAGELLASRYENYLQFRTEKKAEKPVYMKEGRSK